MVSFLEYLCLLERFFAQINHIVLVEWFFAFFWNFQVLIETDHFAKGIALSWAIVFARLPIFKMVSFREYLVSFGAVFCTETL